MEELQMARKRLTRRRRRQVYGIAIGIKRRGKRPPMQIYPKEFTRFEVAAIGVMTIQWAYLEHMLLIATAELVDKANVAMPSEAMSISFERRVNAFRTLIKDTVTDSWKRTQLLSLATKITNIQNDRHRVTHGLWEWYPSNPVKLRLYSFRPQFYFDTNFDLDRLAKLCDRLGEINYELTHPPRKGLSKLEITSEDMSYMSREATIIFGGHDPAKYGIYMPGLPKAGPPHVVPREPSA
jgi:hypothetical protein